MRNLPIPTIATPDPAVEKEREYTRQVFGVNGLPFYGGFVPGTGRWALCTPAGWLSPPYYSSDFRAITPILVIANLMQMPYHNNYVLLIKNGVFEKAFNYNFAAWFIAKERYFCFRIDGGSNAPRWGVYDISRLSNRLTVAPRLTLEQLYERFNIAN